jgi:copper chaperone CopZ
VSYGVKDILYLQRNFLDTMKTLSFLTVLLIILFASAESLQAQKQDRLLTVSFTVYGNCGVGKSRIEQAALSQKGVRSAHWDASTKQLEVTYDTKKVLMADIHKAIAAVGHDTDEVRATDEAYNNLQGCCKYERPKPGLFKRD